MHRFWYSHKYTPVYLHQFSFSVFDLNDFSSWVTQIKISKNLFIYRIKMLQYDLLVYRFRNSTYGEVGFNYFFKRNILGLKYYIRSDLQQTFHLLLNHFTIFKSPIDMDVKQVFIGFQYSKVNNQLQYQMGINLMNEGFRLRNMKSFRNMKLEH